jgi:hypothetical protein
MPIPILIDALPMQIVGPYHGFSGDRQVYGR